MTDEREPIQKFVQRLLVDGDASGFRERRVMRKAAEIIQEQDAEIELLREKVEMYQRVVQHQCNIIRNLEMLVKKKEIQEEGNDAAA